MSEPGGQNPCCNAGLVRARCGAACHQFAAHRAPGALRIARPAHWRSGAQHRDLAAAREKPSDSAYLQIAMSSPCHRHVIDMTSPMALPLPCYCHVIAGSDPTCETIGSGRNTHAC